MAVDFLDFTPKTIKKSTKQLKISGYALAAPKALPCGKWKAKWSCRPESEKVPERVSFWTLMLNRNSPFALRVFGAERTRRSAGKLTKDPGEVALIVEA